jgi:hypothetical protein
MIQFIQFLNKLSCGSVSIDNVERNSATIYRNLLRILLPNVCSFAIFYIGYGLPHRVLLLSLSPYTVYNLLAGSSQYSQLSIESVIRLLCRTVLHRSSLLTSSKCKVTLLLHRSVNCLSNSIQHPASRIHSKNTRAATTSKLL